GFIASARRPDISTGLRRGLKLAQIGAALSVVEMVFHLAATVDRAHLIAGRPTPVLTTHLMVSVVAYPAMGFATARVAALGAQSRRLGAPAIGWLGVMGGVIHGLSAPIVVLTRDEHYSVLFNGVAVLALWFCLTAVWPVGVPKNSAVVA